MLNQTMTYLRHIRLKPKCMERRTFNFFSAASFGIITQSIRDDCTHITRYDNSAFIIVHEALLYRSLTGSI